MQGTDFKLLKIENARQQVVGGMLYYVRLRLASASQGKQVSYEAKIWERPWENFREVQSIEAVEGSEEEFAAVGAADLGGGTSNTCGEILKGDEVLAVKCLTRVVVRVCGWGGLALRSSKREPTRLRFRKDMGECPCVCSSWRQFRAFSAAGEATSNTHEARRGAFKNVKLSWFD